MSNSSTSNSNSPYRFLIRMLAFSLFATIMVQGFRLFGLDYPTIPEPTRPNDIIYMSWDNYNYDHLYYIYPGEEIDPVAEAKKANLLLVGNSRLMMGVSFDTIMTKIDKEKIHPHWMGFGQGEAYQLPAKIIRENNLSPKLVVLNVDATFFRSNLSPYAKSLIEKGRDQAIDYAMSRKRQNYLWRVFMTIFPVPQINTYNWHLEHTRKPLIYRSLKYGDWVYSAPDEMIKNHYPFGKAAPSLPDDYSEQLANAREFVEMLRSRGSEIVFITVPNPEGGEYVAESIGNELGITTISTDWNGYETFDYSHLLPEAAARYTAIMIEKLKSTEEWHRAFPES